ncbi:MAG: hypothetical protein HQL29_06320, partial [Candidatus Omnitrophica bacterium]|nr:hypothetical protein [Candidatus Omnitrophota bacterium]
KIPAGHTNEDIVKLLSIENVKKIFARERAMALLKGNEDLVNEVLSGDFTLTRKVTGCDFENYMFRQIL